jgi:phage-related minor tail protein
MKNSNDMEDLVREELRKIMDEPGRRESANKVKESLDKVSDFVAKHRKDVVDDKLSQLEKELEKTKKKLHEAESELAKMKSDSYTATMVEEKLKQLTKREGNLMAHGIKACADVKFIPKT